MDLMKTKKDFLAIALVLLLIVSGILWGVSGIFGFLIAFAFVIFPLLMLYKMSREEKNKWLVYSTYAAFIGGIGAVVFNTPCQPASIFFLVSLAVFLIGLATSVILVLMHEKVQYVIIDICLVIIVLGYVYLGTGCGYGPRDLCQFQVGLMCSAFRLDASDGTADLTIINGYQEKINITRAACRQQGIPTTWDDYSSSPYSVSAQQSVTINVAEIQDGNGYGVSFQEGDIYTGKCVVEFYYVEEGPEKIRRNTADVKFTAQP